MLSKMFNIILNVINSIKIKILKFPQTKRKYKLARRKRDVFLCKNVTKIQI